MSTLSLLPHELAALSTKPSKCLLDPSPATAHFVEHGIICVTAKKQLSALQGQACNSVGTGVLTRTQCMMWQKCLHVNNDVCPLPDGAGAAAAEASTPLAGAAAGAGKGPWTSM